MGIKWNIWYKLYLIIFSQIRTIFGKYSSYFFQFILKLIVTTSKRILKQKKVIYFSINIYKYRLLVRPTNANVEQH